MFKVYAVITGMIERQTYCSTFITLNSIRKSVVAVRYFKLSELSLRNRIIIIFILYIVPFTEPPHVYTVLRADRGAPLKVIPNSCVLIVGDPHISILLRWPHLVIFILLFIVFLDILYSLSCRHPY